MDVYVLTRIIVWESDDILGVFSSRDSAISAFKQYRQEIHGDPANDPRLTNALKNFESRNDIHYVRDIHYAIQKFTVDQL
ncbi:MAG: hypothetical protein KAW52_02115, partial [candidate division Zixibacteria bacterium]|nr:hypothetical protein [candidate division Zixibacteria bacterium]